MCILTKLPTESLERVLILSDPKDVSSFAQTCRSARRIVYESADSHLWRAMYLQMFDDPRLPDGVTAPGFPGCDEVGGESNGDEVVMVEPGCSGQVIDWKGELQKRIVARSHLDSLETPVPEETKEVVLKTLLSIVLTAQPPKRDTVRPCKNLAFINQHLTSSDLRENTYISPPAHLHREWDLAKTSPTPNPRNIPHYTKSQQAARFHVHYGLSRNEVDSELMRGASRRFVYNLKNYNEKNSWGPYIPDGSGRVNWVHLEAIMGVVGPNACELFEDEDVRTGDDGLPDLPPLGLAFSRPGSMKRVDGPAGDDGDDEFLARDWAGVTGKWKRIVCFMDYRDLFAFNFDDHLMPDLIFPHTSVTDTLEDYREAVRLLDVDLKIVSIDPPSPGRPDSRPAIHFKGKSTGGAPQESTLKGKVSMTPDGEVRWQMISNYGGEDRWISDGVQVGGVKSAMGVLGTWTGHEHDVHDPVGPYWLFKA